MATTTASIEAIIILSWSIFNNEPSMSGIPADIITRGIQVVIKSVILSEFDYTSKLNCCYSNFGIMFSPIFSYLTSCLLRQRLAIF
jgi:hypothetical protein